MGRLIFHWVGENNPLGWIPLDLLQRGVHEATAPPSCARSILLQGPSKPHLCFFLYARAFGYYILFGVCRNEGNHCETTEDNSVNVFSGTKLTVKQKYLASLYNV